MIVPVLLFILGLALLIKGGDWFVDGSVGVARRFHLPELLIGATVVSIGTTLPEVMVSATSAVQGQSEMSYGNAIGSIICNTALIASISIVARPSVVQRRNLRLPVIFFFVAAVFYAAISYFVGSFSRPVGIALLSVFVVYMIFSVRDAKKAPVEELPNQSNELASSEQSDETKTSGNAKEEILTENENDSEKKTDSRKKDKLGVWKDIAFLIIGAVFIAVGARLLVDNGTKIAEALGVPSTVIALTFVALGTSLPELITAITSLIKGHSSLSLGNIIGANLFNLVLVSGLSITLHPFDVPATSMLAGKNMSLLVDIPLMLTVMTLLVVPTLIRGKLARWQGIVLLVLYTGFCALQFAV